VGRGNGWIGSLNDTYEGALPARRDPGKVTFRQHGKLAIVSVANTPRNRIPHAQVGSSHSIRFSVAILSPVLNQSQQGFFVSQACLLLPFAPGGHPLNSTGNRVIDTEPSSHAPCFPSCLAFRFRTRCFILRLFATASFGAEHLVSRLLLLINHAMPLDQITSKRIF